MSSRDTNAGVIGFIGLGVMGEPICRNLARKSGKRVIGFDLDAAPLGRLALDGVTPAVSVAELVDDAAIVFLSLPGGKQLDAICGTTCGTTGEKDSAREGGLLRLTRPGQTVVDLGTSPVDLTRKLGAAFAAHGVDYADAPVARTRQAAEDGTLSIMVGAGPAVFARIEPLLRCCASDVTHCGGVGAGQVVKILNNMVLAQNVAALAEAASIAEAEGVEKRLLFETLSKGSADSFALRNHGMKAMLPEVFPERAFSTDYMLKDMDYALALAAHAGVAASGAENAAALLRQAIAQGYGAHYWPVIARLMRTTGK